MNARAFRLRYTSPSHGDELRGVNVRVEITVVCTSKEQSISMTTFAANMAGLTRIPGIDQDHRHTRVLRLVGDERPQLEERPTLLPIPLRLADLGALPDAFEVFEHDGPSGLLGGIDDAAADDVVDGPLVAFLPPRQPFQEPLALPRALGLGGTPNLGAMRTDSIYLRGFMDRAIAVDGHAATTQIDAECSLGLQELGGLSGQLDMEEVLPLRRLTRVALVGFWPFRSDFCRSPRQVASFTRPDNRVRPKVQFHSWKAKIRAS